MDFGRYKRTEINFSERYVYCERNDTVFEIVATGKKKRVLTTPAAPGTADRARSRWGNPIGSRFRAGDIL